LYISPNGYLGGAERFVLNAAKAHKIKNEIKIGILFFSDGEACKEAQKAGIDFFVLKHHFRMRQPFKFFLALREIRRVVIRFKPDVLHLTMPYSHIVLSLATFGLNLKKVWFQHGPVGGRLDRIANLFPVDMIWYNSHYLKAKHHLTWPSARVKVTENVINLGVDASRSSHCLFSEPIFYLGSAGRICYGKGFHNIIISLGELKKEKKVMPFRLLIAGTSNSIADKEYHQNLIELARSYNLNDEIEFLEHVKDMESFYHRLDILIHSPVMPEAFGLVVAEGMANGCLVIASDDGGVEDLLGNGAYGISFSATGTNAVSELKTILEKILISRDIDQLNRYRDMAEKGRLFVCTNYSMTSMITQIEKLYIELTKR
jgi:glycosyltransferase involved in cell wall biosynthesis